MLRMWLASAVVLCAAACASRPIDPVASRLKHKVPFETGKTESTGEDRIEIAEVWGTRPAIEVGGDYLVLGRYTLRSHDRGTVFFYLTAWNWDNSGVVWDLQRLDVSRGSGTFALLRPMHGPGWFHVSLCGRDGATLREVADVYFGQGDNVLREEPPTVRGPSRRPTEPLRPGR